MNKIVSRYVASAIAAMLLMILFPRTSSAQSGWDVRYRFVPAMAGCGTEVFVGQPNGTILQYDAGTGGMSLRKTLHPGVELPPGVEGVWSLSVPDPHSAPGLIVGLASYSDEGTQRYGVLRSTDMGTTWELHKPAALADPAYTVYTGRNDFKKLTISRMYWLNAQRGWLYGCNGLLTTADGGQSWTNVFKTTKADSVLGQVAFADEMNGVASFGDFHLPILYRTSDGGASWSLCYRPTFAWRIASVTYADGEYRILALDPFQLSGNTYMLFWKGGNSWTLKINSSYAKIRRGQTEMSELLWTGNNVGYMALRSGETWRTSDGGMKWEIFNQALDTTVGSPYRVLSGSMGSDSAFGQKTIILHGERDQIIQAVTGKSTGELQYLEPIGTPLAVASVAAPATQAWDSTGAFPTPAHSQVELRFELPLRSSVHLWVVDMLGREVLRQEPGEMEAGRQRIGLSLESVPGGAYRYIIDAGEHRITGSLVIAR
jgi:hypothetical protein